MKLILLNLIIFLLSSRGWTQEKIYLEDIQAPHVINIISGIPMTGSGDQTGGFGDVAANIFAAKEIKKRHPDTVVNFLVTTDYNETRSVMSSAEIVKTMVPGLNPSLRDQVQTVGGINFIFLNEKDRFVTLVDRDGNEELDAPAIPEADLSVQLSGNNHPQRSVLEAKSKVSMSFYEHDGSTYIRHGPSIFYTGPSSAGFYITKGLLESNPNRQNIVNEWLTTNGHQAVDFSTNSVAFGYSKYAISIQLYLDAMSKLAKRNGGRRYNVIIKDFSDSNLDSIEIPPNLQVIKYKSLPSEVMEAMIAESNLSPLVTGDLSLSTALSSVRKNKAFIYETPPWKESTALSLWADIHVETNDRLSSLLFFKPLELIENTAKRQEYIEDISHLLENSNFFERINSVIKRRLTGWDLIENIMKLYKYKALLNLEIKEHLFSTETLELFAHLFIESKNITEVKAKMRTYLLDPSRTTEERIFCGLFLLKTNEGLNANLTGIVFHQLRDRLLKNGTGDAVVEKFHNFLRWNREMNTVKEFVAAGLQDHDGAIRKTAQVITSVWFPQVGREALESLKEHHEGKSEATIKNWAPNHLVSFGFCKKALEDITNAQKLIPVQ